MRAAMVLCAGLGKRLRPLTDWVAKPMVPIGDAPALGQIIAQLRRAGFERLTVNVHHRPDDVAAWAKRQGGIAISEEPELLGTAGGVERARALLGSGDVLVWNGDIFVELDARALMATHAACHADATLAIVPRAAGDGNVGIASDGRVVRLRNEVFGEESAGADFVGVHVLGIALRAKLPERGCLVGDLYIPALERGARLATHAIESPFIDVGSLAQYVAANRAWLARRGERSWIAPDAAVRARVDGSVVGAGARVEADAFRSVVWPRARVLAPVEDAIVTPHGVVRIAPSAVSGMADPALDRLREGRIEV